MLVELGSFTPPDGPPRPVRAWLSPRLAKRGPRPALILLDGQNVFGDHGSYAGGWHAHDAVDGLGRAFGVPVLIAVANGGAHRIHEMGTGAPGFVDALAAWLPSVTGPLKIGDRRILGGASLGGLASLYGWLRHPDVFTDALAMSPSLWFHHRALLHHLERGHYALPRTGRLYLDAGGRERGRMFADAEELSDSLSGILGERLLWRPDKRGAHHEKHWRRRLPKALRFLLRKAA